MEAAVRMGYRRLDRTKEAEADQRQELCHKSLGAFGGFGSNC